MNRTTRQPADSVLGTAQAIGRSEARILWRDRTAIVFIFVLPAVLAGILGPAVSGLAGDGASGQAALGFAVMFSFMVVTYAGHAFFREHWYGTNARLALIRPSRLGYGLGKIAPSAALAFLQLVIFGIIAVVFLDLPLAGGPVQLLGAGALLVGAGAALGFLFFALTRSTATLSNLAYLVLVTFGALGGAIVVFDRLPRWSQWLGYFTPQFWAMRAARETTFGHGSWTVVGQSYLALLGFCLVFGVIGAWRFDFNAEKDATS
jgi:ABC-2 type transport system permease protein